jgi:hypothetical protein
MFDQLRIFGNYGGLTGNLKIDIYYAIDLVLSSVVQQNLKNLTLRQLSEKKCFIEFGRWSIHSTRVP